MKEISIKEKEFIEKVSIQFVSQHFVQGFTRCLAPSAEQIEICVEKARELYKQLEALK